jgi:molecular chaperone GrpE
MGLFHRPAEGREETGRARMTKVPERRGKRESEANAEGASRIEVGETDRMEAGAQEDTPMALGEAEKPSGEEGKRGQEGDLQAGGEVEAQEADASAADPVQAEIYPEENVGRLVQENEELQDKFVRLMADFDNFRKRAGKEKSEVIQFGNEGLLKDMLPIIDGIERLLTYSYQEGSWKSFQEGIELLLTEIGKTLARYGVEPIEALGKPFDPNLHEAMQRIETAEALANTVVEVYQKGYVYRGRLLRPSLVVVAVPPKVEDEAEGQGGGDGGDEGPAVN